MMTNAKETGIPMKSGSSRPRGGRYLDSSYLRGRVIENEHIPEQRCGGAMPQRKD